MAHKTTTTDQIAAILATIAELSETVSLLKTEIDSLKTIGTKAPKTKKDGTKPARKREFTDEQIREIFRLKHIQKLSGYRIAKNMGVNSVRINSILRRDIYSDVNVSDIIDGTEIPTTEDPVTVVETEIVIPEHNLTEEEIAEFAAEYDMASAEPNPAIKEDWQN